MNQTILIIEDDLDIQNFLVESLRIYGFNAIANETGREALSAIKQQQIDLVLLDVELPDTNGFQLCEQIRQFSQVPIIFVSCRDDGSDIIKGLELGGDDYVTKPFDLHQLIARIKSNLRRTPFQQNLEPFQYAEQREIGNIKMDFGLQRLFINEDELILSNKEFQLFSIFLSNPVKIFNSHDLYTFIWGAESFGDSRTIKVHISRLRKKLDEHPGPTPTIQTIRGYGYKFLMNDESQTI